MPWAQEEICSVFLIACDCGGDTFWDTRYLFTYSLGDGLGRVSFSTKWSVWERGSCTHSCLASLALLFEAFLSQPGHFQSLVTDLFPLLYTWKGETWLNDTWLSHHVVFDPRIWHKRRTNGLSIKWEPLFFDHLRSSDPEPCKSEIQAESVRLALVVNCPIPTLVHLLHSSCFINMWSPGLKSCLWWNMILKKVIKSMLCLSMFWIH